VLFYEQLVNTRFTEKGGEVTSSPFRRKIRSNKSATRGGENKVKKREKLLEKQARRAGVIRENDEPKKGEAQ
jgi:hypothetical protein